MEPNAFYRKLASEITDSDLSRCLNKLSWHVGKENAVSLEELTQALYWNGTDSNQRKVRILIERLVTEYHIPIGSVSGQSGRWIIANEIEKQEVAAELASREQALKERRLALLNTKLPANLHMEKYQAQLWG
jgi:hypothetical protein